MKPLKTMMIGALCMGALSISAMALSTGGTVTASGLNMRAEPNAASAIYCVAPKDSAVVVMGEEDGQWYKVHYRGRTGYMSAEYIAPAEVLTGELGTGAIQGTKVRMRSEPSEESTVLGEYGSGTAMTVIGVHNGWYHVSCDGKTGYVRSDFLSLSGAASPEQVPRLSSTNTMTDEIYIPEETAPPAEDHLGQAIVDTAMQYLGVSYVYGGMSPAGFDCSGFVGYVYAQHGYTLGRTAEDISKNGVEVAKSDLQLGDIIYLNNGPGGSIGHVGIYTGDNQMIHASTGARRVIVTDLSLDYYVRYYAGARRII